MFNVKIITITIKTQLIVLNLRWGHLIELALCNARSEAHANVRTQNLPPNSMRSECSTNEMAARTIEWN